MARDPVLEHLLEITRDSLSRLQEIVSVTRSGVGNLFDVFNPGDAVSAAHPVQSAFLEAARADPPLRRVFDAAERDELFYLSIGRGTGFAPSSLAASLVAGAAWELLVRGQPITEDVVTQEVERSLNRLRGLLNGDADMILRLSAFSGVGLTEGTEIKTPWGTLRPATPAESATEPFHRTDPFDPMHQHSRADMVLVGELPLRVAFGVSHVAPVGDDDARLRQDLVSLSVLLAVQREEPVAPFFLWEASFPLVEVGRGSTSRVRRGQNPFRSPQAPLERAEAEAVEEMSRLIHEHYDATIGVAVTRVLSAIHERYHPEDALIDAVIAWENLFGHGEASEVVFRVTGAAACLLTPPDDRLAYRRDLRKVYDARSSLIHGSVTPADVLTDHSTLAINVAIASLREVFQRRPDLIAKKDRGLRLLLSVPDDAG